MSYTDEDYVTVLPTADRYKFIACVMIYRKRDDEYVQARCSRPLPEVAARNLARAWASAIHKEVR